MNHGMAILSCAFGLLAIFAAATGKDFKQTDYATGSKDLGPIPTWLGKLLFTIIGLIFLLHGTYVLWANK